MNTPHHTMPSARATLTLLAALLITLGSTPATAETPGKLPAGVTLDSLADRSYWEDEGTVGTFVNETVNPLINDPLEDGDTRMVRLKEWPNGNREPALWTYRAAPGHRISKVRVSFAAYDTLPLPEAVVGLVDVQGSRITSVDYLDSPLFIKTESAYPDITPVCRRTGAPEPPEGNWAWYLCEVDLPAKAKSSVTGKEETFQQVSIGFFHEWMSAPRVGSVELTVVPE